MGAVIGAEPPFDPLDGLLERIVDGSKKFFGRFKKKEEVVLCSYCGDNLDKYLGGLYSSVLKKVYCPPESGRECKHMEEMNEITKRNGEFKHTVDYLSMEELRKLKNKGLIIPPKEFRPKFKFNRY